MAQRIRKIKYAPPPPELPIYGKVNPKECSFFGRTNYEAALEEKKFIFGIKRADRRRHLYLVGKSGVGKSKLMELIIRQDIAYGHGVCLIDPHGDFIEDILKFIPKERIDDVVLIDPSDTEFPVSFNPLSNSLNKLAYCLIVLSTNPFPTRYSTKSCVSIDLFPEIFGIEWFQMPI